MQHAAHVDFSEMADQLLPLDQVRERLAATEPLSELTFPTGSQLQFTVHPGWADVGLDELTGATLATGHSTFNLTKQALLEAGAYCGIPRGYQARCPATLLEAQLNYWYREGWVSESKAREFKVLSLGSENQPEGTNPTALAMCRGTINPFSNVTLLDIAVGKIREKYGAATPIYGDYKFFHTLENTNVRLIVPGESRIIEGTGTADDTWSAGIDIRNSLIGLKPPVVQGYLFRWWCTNGSTDTLLSTGQFSRRGSHEDEDVWTWARESVDAILGGLDAAFAGVQALTGVSVAHEVRIVLDDLFDRYTIPAQQRNRVIQYLAEQEGTPTLYSLMQAITFAANEDGLEPRTVSALMGLGGHITHAPTLRCNEDHPCRRLMPEDYVIPGEVVHPEAVTA